MKTALAPSSGTSKSFLGANEFFSSFSDKKSWEPEWLSSHRKTNWNLYQSLSGTKSKDDRWRFSPRSRFSYSKVSRLSSSSSHLSFKAVDESGVLVSSIEEVTRDQPDYLMNFQELKGPELGAQESFLLACAFAENGFHIRVGRNVRHTEPIVIDHTSPRSDEVAFHRNLIVMEPNSELILIERISSGNLDESGFLTNLTNVKVGNGAKLHRILIQNLDLNSTFHNLENFEIQRNSCLRNVSIQLGSAQARIETKGNLLETGANFENYALTLGKKDQLIDTRTMQHHLASNGRSDLVCKNALLDDSKIVFSGLIKVDERASFSDALQTNRNLLMSSDCEADSLPGLEILANEVKCSHGATSSRVDDKELFYFLSRGIHKSESEKLIALGFLDEIIQKINLADQIEIVRGLISGSFPKN